MTALAAAASRTRRDGGQQASYPVLAATQIWKGGLVAVDTAGYARPATDTAGYTVVGVAAESVLGGTASGDKWILLECGREFLFPATSITQAMVGDPMYVVDDNEVDDAAGAANDVFAGILTQYVSNTSGWVFVAQNALPLSGVTASASELNLLDVSRAAGVTLGVASGTLSNAQLLALRATPISVITAPGVGRTIIPLMVSLFYDFAGADFVQTNNADHLALRYSGGVEICEIGSEAQCTAFLESVGADASLVWQPTLGWVPTANEAVQFDNNGAAEYTNAGGTGVIDYYIIYAVVPVA